MTDQVQEGALPVVEPEELAVPQVSGTDEEVQQPSVPGVGITEDRINELLEEKLGALTDQLEKQAQSAKDRGISANAKQINDIFARLDELGGNKEALIQEVDQQALLDKINTLEAQISQGPASPVQMPSGKSAWQAEWAEEAQKILDTAAKSGVSLSKEEYNGAMFNNSIQFKSKGEAYAALNQALISKAKGEAIPVAAVATEGGDVAKPPAPPAEPKTATQRFEEAKAAGDQQAMEAAQAERWDAVEKLQKTEAARKALEAAGVSAEDLIEK
jgi:hypothetical protein